MSLRQIQLGDLRPIVGRVTGICASDNRNRDLINEAQERLLDVGNWLGSVVGVRICTTSSCITWPRQVSTILAYALCRTPGVIYDRWYEFLPNGPGLRTECCGSPDTLLPKDPACTFDDLWDSQSNVGLQCDVAETANTYATIEGYDNNGQWIRTLDGSTLINGFKLLLSQTMQISPMLVSKITRVRLPVPRNGMARLWQVTSGTVIKPLGFYENDEDTPWYRRSFVPGLTSLSRQSSGGNTAGSSCGCPSASQNTSGACCCKQVDVIVKLKHIPVVNDTDWLILCNPSAIKLACMAIQKEERNLGDEARSYMAQAIQLLENEKQNYDGDGTTAVLSVAHTNVFGGGAVENDIGTPVMMQ